MTQMPSATSPASVSKPISATADPVSLASTGSSKVSGNFKSRRDESAKQVDGKTLGIVVVADEPEELDWRERLKQWCRSRAASGYGISLAFHLLLIIVLSFIVLTNTRPVETVTTRFSGADPAGLEFGDITFDPRDDLLELLANTPELTQFRAVLPPPTIEVPVPDFSVDPDRKVDDRSGGAGQGNGMRAKSGKAVTKGNFTVWTVPEDPEPRQSYIIVIEIKLPKKVTRYPLKDLSGLVVGTDGWKQPIPGKSQGFARVVDHKTQLEIMVPGARRLVNDTIRIRSRILKEQQVLLIVF
jgi:hypothetical protein